MYVFLPYPNFQDSIQCLDIKTLLQQRLDAHQLINVIKEKHHKDNIHTGTIAWSTHPLTLMWEKYLPALKMYFNIVHMRVNECYPCNNEFTLEKISVFNPPIWMGESKLHRSHKSKLTSIYSKHYNKFWEVPNNLHMVYPQSISTLTPH